MIKLEENEKIKIFLRRHWLVLGLEIAVFLALILLGFLIYNYLNNSSSQLGFLEELSVIWQKFMPLLLIIYLLILWSVSFTAVINYYLDVWVVTDKRIIDIEQHGLFHREVSEFALDRIQDVTVEVKGVLATFFDFGNIHVQTAGEHREFIFKQVPKPYQAKDLILTLTHFSNKTTK